MAINSKNSNKDPKAQMHLTFVFVSVSVQTSKDLTRGEGERSFYRRGRDRTQAPSGVRGRDTGDGHESNQAEVEEGEVGRGHKRPRTFTELWNMES